MSAIDVYDCRFDEDDGKTIIPTTCKECCGRMRTEGGETDFESSGLASWAPVTSFIRVDQPMCDHDKF